MCNAKQLAQVHRREPLEPQNRKYLRIDGELANSCLPSRNSLVGHMILPIFRLCGDIYNFRVPGVHADVLVEVGIGFDMHRCRFKRIQG